MRPLVLHIGPHKTGSTTIQRGLDLNAGPLAAMGYVVPPLDSRHASPTRSHPILCNAVKRGTTGVDPHWAALLTAAAASDGTFIVSAEQLSLHFLDRRKLDKLVATLAACGLRPCFV